uniref:Vps4_C domain-containing protein n=1 Tax=Caenorhabditis tropicalis TaxID=1561998 RepID=A0A1I7UYA8_9PELO
MGSPTFYNLRTMCRTRQKLQKVTKSSKMSGKLEIISLEEFDEPFEEILKSEAEEAEKYADKWLGNSFDSWETVSSVGVNVSYSNYQF